MSINYNYIDNIITIKKFHSAFQNIIINIKLKKKIHNDNDKNNFIKIKTVIKSFH